MRALLARAPLAAHVLLGAVFGGTVGLLTSFHEEEGEDDGELLSPAAEAALLGAVRGAAFRWWYPAVERWASRASTPHGAVALAALLDTLPTQLGQAAIHTVHTTYYKMAFGSPYNADDALQEVGRRVIERKLGDLGAAAAGAGSAEHAGASTSSGGRGDLQRTTLDEDDEFEDVVSSIYSSELSAANPLTALVSLLNFLIVPRWARGLVGVGQASLYDAVSIASNEDKHQVLVVPVPIPIPFPGGGEAGPSPSRRWGGDGGPGSIGGGGGQLV